MSGAVCSEKSGRTSRLPKGDLLSFVDGADRVASASRSSKDTALGKLGSFSRVPCQVGKSRLRLGSSYHQVKLISEE